MLLSMYTFSSLEENIIKIYTPAVYFIISSI